MDRQPAVVEKRDRYEGKHVPNVCEIKTSNGVAGMQCGGRSGGTYGTGEAMTTRDTMGPARCRRWRAEGES
jgi:hypothetical protein